MVSMRPYYLPREFSHVIKHTVYVPRRNFAKASMSELLDVIGRFESSAFDAFTVINGCFDNYNP